MYKRIHSCRCSDGISSEIAPACNGEQLKMTCTTTGSFLQWNVTLLESEAMINSYTRTFSSGDSSSKQPSITINSTMISFVRTSAEGVSPLISTLVISPISRTFNGSRVECIELPRGTSESSFTVVHVMDFDCNCKLRSVIHNASQVELSIHVHNT